MMNSPLAALPETLVAPVTDPTNVSSEPRDGPGASASVAVPHTVLSTKDLCSAAQCYGRWLFYGYLAPGALTLMTSQWKAGKTTLLSVLLARQKTGGTVAGLAVTPGKAMVVSEEDPVHWYERSRWLDFGNHIRWMCRPFKGKPTMQQWLDLINQLADLHRQDAMDLVVIDTLGELLPAKCESSADAMLAALLPLQQLTGLGLSVLLLHHATKKDCLPGLASRGTGALPSHVDILLELRWHGRPADDNRRRRLLGFSRYRETPRELVIEWTADGTDYISLGSGDIDGFVEQWEVLKTVLEDAEQKLTRQEILQQWPADFPKPDPVTLYRWLQRALPLGHICQEGSGRRREPFRYWLPERTDDFPPAGASSHEMVLWNSRMSERRLKELQKS